MTDRVRVRYAPSPTGATHVGNVRTAIFTWLFARGNDGDFIIRVEDTDQNRNVEDSIEMLLEALAWLGLDWDEGPDVGGPSGPYYQSQRLEMYTEAAEALIAGGHAYRCYCSSERLAELRRSGRQEDGSSGYDGRCRDLSYDERAALESSDAPAVVRFRMPRQGTTTLVDMIHGEVTFENRLIDDFVMLRSNGFPTYHLANVVDDHQMRISHVMRGDDWLSSSPRHVRLYEAMGWAAPRFAHLPMILAPDRTKLGKRHGAASVLEYREMGYLPQTMVNFLSLLGWSLDDRTDIISRDDLIGNFSIERISKAGAVFNTEKLNWMNGAYIRMLSVEELTDALLDYWRRYPPAEITELPNRDRVLAMAPLVQERLKELSEAAPRLSFFFRDAPRYDSEDLVQKGMDAAGTRRALEAALEAMEPLATFDVATLEPPLRALAKELGVKVGQLFGSLRIATTGLRVAPPLFETMEVLGRERTLRDIRAAIESIAEHEAAQLLPTD